MSIEKKTFREEVLDYHSICPAGKLAVTPSKPHKSQHYLSLAYTPGVAIPCLEIAKDESLTYKYTGKGNLVAVISNGTAVLGLGNIGASASKPVMEGKSMLFKVLSDIDSFDIEVSATSIDEFVNTVKNISPTFGGINLEDIKAPECFEIERRLREELDIPVMHDDQHGTAIITSAALINSLELAGKKLEDVRVVINGAGAAAIACGRLYLKLGIKPQNIVMCDSKGVIHKSTKGLTAEKQEFATERDTIHTLSDAIVNADVFLGVSKANVLTKEMVRTMNHNPIVMALSNPDPEISYEEAISSREDLIFATGRSDYPNQVNNVSGFPYLFRGALDVRATQINEEMKLAAAYEIAAIAKEPVTDEVREAYQIKNISFSKDYILPKPLDRRLLWRVSMAVAKAAIKSGVARENIEDWNKYENMLKFGRCKY